MDPDRLLKAVTGLVDLVEKLRGPGGCPWDAKQTDATIKLYLLEEAYEVLDAIEKTSPPDVCEELGDLLFHIFFLARLAEERKEFDFSEVVEKITEKMIRRHPHVFGNTTVDSADDVAVNWARIKQEEKKTNGDTSSLLDGVPISLPSLLRAHRLGERASKAGVGTLGAHDAWERVLEKIGDMKETAVSKDKDLLGQEIGALLFRLADLARLWGLNSEQLLRDANREFLNRI
ncbi:MAG: nucleoside triphosphate pyrophosphohydrolase [Deltaproteobacteria bacterium]|nr:nucleoside triphosphate pyrophosphohydrolase [Deltaproteobacteria bacterium]